MQATGPRTCASYISNGKQGRIHRDKYLKSGKPCPVAIIIGTDPITYLAAGYTMPDSMPEYEWAGGKYQSEPAEQRGTGDEYQSADEQLRTSKHGPYVRAPD